MNGVGKGRGRIGGRDEATNYKAPEAYTDTPAALTAPNDTSTTDTPDQPKDPDISKKTTTNKDMVLQGAGTIQYGEQIQATRCVHMELTPSKSEKIFQKFLTQKG